MRAALVFAVTRRQVLEHDNTRRQVAAGDILRCGRHTADQSVIAVGERGNFDSRSVNAAGLRLVSLLHRNRLTLHLAGERERPLDRQDAHDAGGARSSPRVPQREIAFDQRRIHQTDRGQTKSGPRECGQNIGRLCAGVNSYLHQRIACRTGQVNAQGGL